MRRPPRIIIGALALLAFLAITFGLARVLNANGAERSAILALVRAQAAGDAEQMVARIEGCAASAACVEQTREIAARLRSQGKVELVRLDPSTSFSPGGSEGVARVVWKTPSRTTVVQCVDVDRGGDLVAGLSIELRALSPPIDRESSCPARD